MEIEFLIDSQIEIPAGETAEISRLMLMVCIPTRIVMSGMSEDSDAFVCSEIRVGVECVLPHAKTLPMDELPDFRPVMLVPGCDFCVCIKNVSASPARLVARLIAETIEEKSFPDKTLVCPMCGSGS